MHIIPTFDIISLPKLLFRPMHRDYIINRMNSSQDSTHWPHPILKPAQVSTAHPN